MQQALPRMFAGLERMSLMLGYSVSVLLQSPDEALTQEGRRRRQEVTLAYWYGGGVPWLQDLIREGKAQEHGRSGYPDLYTARASDVLPILLSLPELGSGETAQRNRIIGLGNGIDMTIHFDRIAACPPDQILTLELWDQS